jgi:hypothetical protein
MRKVERALLPSVAMNRCRRPAGIRLRWHSRQHSSISGPSSDCRPGYRSADDFNAKQSKTRLADDAVFAEI